MRHFSKNKTTELSTWLSVEVSLKNLKKRTSFRLTTDETIFFNEEICLPLIMPNDWMESVNYLFLILLMFFLLKELFF